MKVLVAIMTATALTFVTPAWAQSQPEVNNGTNPTLLATSAGIQYKYTDFGSGFSNDLAEAFFSVPFGAKKKYVPGIPASLRLRANR